MQLLPLDSLSSHFTDQRWASLSGTGSYLDDRSSLRAYLLAKLLHERPYKLFQSRALEYCVLNFDEIDYRACVQSVNRREFTIPTIKLLVLIHSACPCKNYVPKCPQKPQELFNRFYLVCKVCNVLRGPHTKQKKMVRIAVQSVAMCRVYAAMQWK